MGNRNWMDQYLLIPFFRGMNIHKSQLFWCELQGYRGLTWDLVGMLMGFSWDDHRMLMGFDLGVTQIVTWPCFTHGFSWDLGVRGSQGGCYEFPKGILVKQPHGDCQKWWSNGDTMRISRGYMGIFWINHDDLTATYWGEASPNGPNVLSSAWWKTRTILL